MWFFFKKKIGKPRLAHLWNMNQFSRRNMNQFNQWNMNDSNNFCRAQIGPFMKYESVQPKKCKSIQSIEYRLIQPTFGKPRLAHLRNMNQFSQRNKNQFNQWNMNCFNQLLWSPDWPIYEIWINSSKWGNFLSESCWFCEMDEHKTWECKFKQSHHPPNQDRIQKITFGRVAKCQFFYTEQIFYIKFYPKKRA